MIIFWILPLAFCGISFQFDSSGVELDCTRKLECLCISVYNSITKSWYRDRLGQKRFKDYIYSLVKSKETNTSFSRFCVRIWKSYLMNFVKCLKRNLNATFTICYFRNSQRKINVLIYRICLSMPWKPNLLYLHYPFSFIQHSASFILSAYYICIILFSF